MRVKKMWRTEWQEEYNRKAKEYPSFDWLHFSSFLLFSVNEWRRRREILNPVVDLNKFCPLILRSWFFSFSSPTPCSVSLNSLSSYRHCSSIRWKHWKERRFDQLEWNNRQFQEEEKVKHTYLDSVWHKCYCVLLEYNCITDFSLSRKKARKGRRRWK